MQLVFCLPGPRGGLRALARSHRRGGEIVPVKTVAIARTGGRSLQAIVNHACGSPEVLDGARQGCSGRRAAAMTEPS
jgi:hypothetical protein